MNFKVLIPILALVGMFYETSYAQKHKKVRAYSGNAIPAPDGMVYIPAGSIVMKYGQSADSDSYKKVSLSPFFIDKTEVTNKEYREFINWSLDSVLIKNYINSADYFQKGIPGDSTSPQKINWSKVDHKDLLTKNRNALAALYEADRIKPDIYVFTYRNAKITTDESGKSSVKYVYETVPVYPNTAVWATDFPNSQSMTMVEEYFTNPLYDDYPVVGITWQQAMAYAYWRTNCKITKSATPYRYPYQLPTEAQWVQAALGGIEQSFNDTTGEEETGKKLVNNANFKQDEGEYTADGSAYTLPVLAYGANAYGVYNMIGNVAEWCLDSYNESAWAFIHDLNPVLTNDVDNDAPDMMKRKVVRGGSWKDNAKSLDPLTRNYEIQDIPHSYIGFRCVMRAPEIMTEAVETRGRAKKK